MQFRVPQFIDIEDKILGPLSWTQTAYVLGAGGVTYIVLRLVSSKLLAILIAAPLAGILLAFAFVKINNRTFLELVSNAFKYYANPSLYTWKRQIKEASNENIVQRPNLSQVLPKESKKSLKEIALGLDTKVGGGE